MKLHVRAHVQFEPRDLWIGVYWKRPVRRALLLYICLVPMLPIVVSLIFLKPGAVAPSR